ncbi:hypothetical protein Tco_0214245 [Tanacetum coccineum]
MRKTPLIRRLPVLFVTCTENAEYSSRIMVLQICNFNHSNDSNTYGQKITRNQLWHHPRQCNRRKLCKDPEMYSNVGRTILSLTAYNSGHRLKTFWKEPKGLMLRKRVMISKNHLHQLLAGGCCGIADHAVALILQSTFGAESSSWDSSQLDVQRSKPVCYCHEQVDTCWRYLQVESSDMYEMFSSAELEVLT